MWLESPLSEVTDCREETYRDMKVSAPASSENGLIHLRFHQGHTVRRGYSRRCIHIVFMRLGEQAIWIVRL
jgi:hypothetical protein